MLAGVPVVPLTVEGAVHESPFQVVELSRGAQGAQRHQGPHHQLLQQDLRHPSLAQPAPGAPRQQQTQPHLIIAAGTTTQHAARHTHYYILLGRHHDWEVSAYVMVKSMKALSILVQCWHGGCSVHQSHAFTIT